MLGWLVARARDRAAHPGVRQVRAQRRDLLRAPTSPTTTRATSTSARRGKELQAAIDGRFDVAAQRRRRRTASMRYRASKRDCDACPLKPRCCPNTPARKIPRSIHEGARDMARDIAKTDAYVISRRQRKKVEMLFAHLKRILRLDRLATTRPERRPRRVPPRRHRPEPPEARQARSRCRPQPRRKGPSGQGRFGRYPQNLNRLFQRYRRVADGK